MDINTIQVVRGSPARAFRMLGGAMAVFIPIPMIGLWVFAKDPSTTKIVVSLSMIVVAGVLTLCACVASATAIAEVRSRRLNFYFCGMRTRSIPLDGSTNFELRRIGRLQVLRIQSSGSSYVPNGALNIGDIVDLLKANGVAERKAE